MRLTRRGRLAVTLTSAAAVVLAGSLLVDALDGPDSSGGSGAGGGRVPEGEASAPVRAVATPSSAPSSEPSSEPSSQPPPAPPTPALPPGLTADDVAAGLLAAEVPDAGDGQLVPVPGSVPAPGPGAQVRVRVEVEGGLPVDPPRVADAVMAALNDPRGWGADGSRSFARTDGDADVRVVLASPRTSAALCAPLQTSGRLSCRTGDAAVITHHRWVLGTEEYRATAGLAAYRQYVVNREVGHVLGHGHESCPGAGQPAPVMQQQTKGLQGCAPNPWPNP